MDNLENMESVTWWTEIYDTFASAGILKQLIVDGRQSYESAKDLKPWQRSTYSKILNLQLPTHFPFSVVLFYKQIHLLLAQSKLENKPNRNL